MQRIYLDYAATSPVDEDVLETMLPYMRDCFYNPSSFYSQNIKYDLENARNILAQYLDAKSSEIIFTSGGTESNNLAVCGIMRQHPGRHLIVSEIEHDSVLQTAKQLEQEGYAVTYLKVNEKGRISLENLKQSITEKTVLISIMAVNNEIGTIQDIRSISAIAKERGIYFHTDAVQALGQIPLLAEYADLMSFSAHKIYGPKGVGALYVKKGIKLQSILFGGKQESGKRAGTENIPAIMGFAKAIENLQYHQAQRLQNQARLGCLLMDSMSRILGVRLNGDKENKVNSIYHFSIEGISTEVLLTRLDMEGIAVSAGSACQAGSYQVSHVMKAIGETSSAHLRISVGKDTTEEEITIFIKKLEKLILHLRKIAEKK